MEFSEEKWLQLSGIQHFAFCQRQWALIHVEQQWNENVHTAQGQVFHTNAHNKDKWELRGNKLTAHGLRVQSARLGISGECDVVEFIREEKGICLPGYDGLWQVHPVEYKKGSPKHGEGYSPDALQLCAQAICLEEMLCCTIPSADLFYGETHHRVSIALDHDIRQAVEEMVLKMHQYMQRGHTPLVRKQRGCQSCSLADLCLPSMHGSGTVQAYMDSHFKGVGTCENC